MTYLKQNLSVWAQVFFEIKICHSVKPKTVSLKKCGHTQAVALDFPLKFEELFLDCPFFVLSVLPLSYCFLFPLSFFLPLSLILLYLLHSPPPHLCFLHLLITFTLSFCEFNCLSCLPFVNNACNCSLNPSPSATPPSSTPTIGQRALFGDKTKMVLKMKTRKAMLKCLQSCNR